MIKHGDRQPPGPLVFNGRVVLRQVKQSHLRMAAGNERHVHRFLGAEAHHSRTGDAGGFRSPDGIHIKTHEQGAAFPSQMAQGGPKLFDRRVAAGHPGQPQNRALPGFHIIGMLAAGLTALDAELYKMLSRKPGVLKQQAEGRAAVRFAVFQGPHIQVGIDVDDTQLGVRVVIEQGAGIGVGLSVAAADRGGRDGRWGRWGVRGHGEATGGGCRDAAAAQDGEADCPGNRG